MNSLGIYLVQATLVFSILYLAYRLFLSRLTFHKLNRYLMLSLIPISLLFPLVNYLFPSMSAITIDVPIYEGIDFGNLEAFAPQETATPQTQFNYSFLLLLLYLVGFGLSFLRLVRKIRKLILIKKRAIAHAKDGYKLVITDGTQIFSFFNWVFIPESKKDDDHHIILEHEKAHVKLRHSIDTIVTELYITLFWFNPFAYFFRKSLKSIHEFQADNSVIENKVKPSDYLQQLLQNIEANASNTISSYFNYPSLKNRITMITKVKSTQITKLRYLVLLPIFLFFLVAFTHKNTNNIGIMSSNNILEETSSIPSLFPVKGKSKADITAYYGVTRKHSKSNENTTHGGIDIKADIGTAVLASADGTISKATLEGNWGNLIVITHSDNYQSWYAHLNDFTVEEGQTVTKGEVIGYVGTTGLSTGPHLHYEVKLNGERVDPLDYISQ